MWSKTTLKAEGTLKLDLTIKVDQVGPSQIQSIFEHPTDVGRFHKFSEKLVPKSTTLTGIFLPII